MVEDCGDHDWRESRMGPHHGWCSKCRQRRVSINGQWVRAPMSASKSESEAAMVRNMLDGPPRLVGIDYGSDGMTTECKVELQADGSIKVLDVRRTPEPSK